MVTLQQELEEPSLRTAFDHRFHPHGLQKLERTCNGRLVVRDPGNWAVAQPVDRSGPARGQPNLALGLQLQQQSAARHILEPTHSVAPVPNRTQFTGQPRPIRVRMGLQPVSNQRDILRADRPPLYDQFWTHGLRNTAREEVSPEKRAVLISGSRRIEGLRLPKLRVRYLKMRIAAFGRLPR